MFHDIIILNGYLDSMATNIDPLSNWGHHIYCIWIRKTGNWCIKGTWVYSKWCQYKWYHKWLIFPILWYEWDLFTVKSKIIFHMISNTYSEIYDYLLNIIIDATYKRSDVVIPSDYRYCVIAIWANLFKLFFYWSRVVLNSFPHINVGSA